MKAVLKDARNLDKKHWMEKIFLLDSSAKYPLTPHPPFKITSVNFLAHPIAQGKNMLNWIVQYLGFYTKMEDLAHICLLAVSSAPGLLGESTQDSGCQAGKEFSRLRFFAQGTVKINLMKITDGFQNMSKDSKLGNSRED